MLLPKLHVTISNLEQVINPNIHIPSMWDKSMIFFVKGFHSFVKKTFVFKAIYLFIYS